MGSNRRTARDYWPAPTRDDAWRDASEEDAMLIVTVLRAKGDAVVTVPPECDRPGVLATLAEHRIGAVVVSSGAGIAGIVSERDVVRHLPCVRGGGPRTERSASIMTTDGRHVPARDPGRRADGDDDRAAHPPRARGRRARRDRRHREHRRPGEEPHLRARGRARRPRRLHRRLDGPAQAPSGQGRIRFSCTSVASRCPDRSCTEPRYTPRAPAADTGSSAMNIHSSACAGRWK